MKKIEGKNNLIIYHNDADGICSAAIVSKFLGNETKEFCPIQYGDPFNFERVDTNTVVWVVDFSFPQEYMWELDQRSFHFYWYDHHLSAKGIRTTLFENTTGICDEWRSGCGLTWSELFKDKPCPLSVALIEDRDLWKFNLDNTKEFHEWFSLNVFGPEDEFWDKALESDTRDLMIDVIRDGKLLLKSKEKSIKYLVEKKGYFGTIKSYPAFFVNSPMYQSEIGEYVYTRSKDPIVVVIYNYIDEAEVICSLRSDKINVRDIAETYNGGGHDNAAGFSVNGVNSKLFNKLKIKSNGFKWGERQNDSI